MATAVNCSEGAYSSEQDDSLADACDVGHKICQAVAVAGLAGNVVSAPVLASRHLPGAFYKMLFYLTVTDGLYLLIVLVEDYVSDAYFRDFPAEVYAMFRTAGVLMHTSIFLTVLLALERFLVVSRPLASWTTQRGRSSSNALRRVGLVYFLPSVAFAFAFNAPQFFEMTFKWTSEGVLLVSGSSLAFKRGYTLWYINVSILLVTGAVPLILLCFFNGRIFQTMRARQAQLERLGVGGGGGGEDAGRKRAYEQLRTCVVTLFVVVSVFVLSHSLRLCINMADLVTFDYQHARRMAGCDTMWPYWLALAKCFWNIPAAVNASVNFLLYASTSAAFRTALKNALLCRSSAATSTIGLTSRQMTRRTQVEN